MGISYLSWCVRMVKRMKAYIAMFGLQFGYAGLHIITVLCLHRGMSHYILVVYRHAVATLAIAPFAYLFERKIRPKMTLEVFLKIMLLGLIEPVIDQNLYYMGLKYTSATFTSAVVNVLPSFTFVMALLFRMESIDVKDMRSVAKVIGTTVTLGGALIMTLYKGPVVDIIPSHSKHTHTHNTTVSLPEQHWVAGTLMVIGSIFGWSVFYILQSFTLKKYPAELSLTSLICFTGMTQGAVVALVMERDMSAWALGFDSRLLAAVYSGLVCSGLAYYVQAMVIKERGPVFVTAFAPLAMIITAILGAIFLAEQVHLGSVIGATIIVMGLYSVVWGKSYDQLSGSGIDKGGQSAFQLPIVDSATSISGAADKPREHVGLPTS